MHVALKTIAHVTSRSALEPGAAGNDGRPLLGQRAQQERTERPRRRRRLNSAYSAIASVAGRVRAGQSDRLSTGGARPRRRLVRSRLRVRRHSRQPRLRQLSVGLALVARTTRAASLHRRDARPTPKRKAWPASSTKSSRPERFPGYATAQPEHRHAGLLSQPERRGRRCDARPALLVLRRHRRLQSRPPLRRSVRRCGVRRRVRPAARGVSVPVALDRTVAAVVLHQRKAERRPERHARLDPRPDRLRHRSTRRTSPTARRIVNLHVGIPHKNDGLRDDVQLLYDNDEIFTTFFSSVNDEGYQPTGSRRSASFPPYYLDVYQYNGPTGTFLPANYASLVTPYFYPSSPPHPFVRPDPRSVQSARPRLQRPGDRQAAVSEELQLERVPAASTATRTTPIGSKTAR